MFAYNAIRCLQVATTIIDGQIYTQNMEGMSPDGKLDPAAIAKVRGVIECTCPSGLLQMS
jgi:hypothetical protein